MKRFDIKEWKSNYLTEDNVDAMKKLERKIESKQNEVEQTLTQIRGLISYPIDRTDIKDSIKLSNKLTKLLTQLRVLEGDKVDVDHN
tara:strand:- start:987 stop:1247 length:261 start_codon:yes stop_codon:yes gene_type:complete